MNERILKLVEQAGVTGYFAAGTKLATPIPLSPEMEKFAELIVQEMLAITDAHTEVFQTDRDRALIEHIKKSVTQHFGVEE